MRCLNSKLEITNRMKTLTWSIEEINSHSTQWKRLSEAVCGRLFLVYNLRYLQYARSINCDKAVVII